jgi:hypothetical protein
MQAPASAGACFDLGKMEFWQEFRELFMKIFG